MADHKAESHTSPGECISSWHILIGCSPIPTRLASREILSLDGTNAALEQKDTITIFRKAKNKKPRLLELILTTINNFLN